MFASEFSFEFDWSDLKKCTTGNPNTVKNPIFIQENVPNGTKFIYFKLTDKMFLHIIMEGGGLNIKVKMK